MTTLQDIITERPSFHQSETEIERRFDIRESLLSKNDAEKLASGSSTCYGLGAEVLAFIAESVNEESKTLEIGAGCSTVVFALKHCEHIAVTPSTTEANLILEYLKDKNIFTEKLSFVNQSSDAFLPASQIKDLDLVLIDGKHAFPWPIIDWFYTADKLKKSGLMIIDDAELPPVKILIDFMSSDPGWQLVKSFSNKSVVFSKLRESVHDVAWHMQPFSMPVKKTATKRGKLVKRIKRRLQFYFL